MNKIECSVMLSAIWYLSSSRINAVQTNSDIVPDTLTKNKLNKQTNTPRNSLASFPHKANIKI